MNTRIEIFPPISSLLFLSLPSFLFSTLFSAFLPLSLPIPPFPSFSPPFFLLTLSSLLSVSSAFFSTSQLIYDFKDGGGSLGLISLHPEKLSEEDKQKFLKIGVSIPSKL